MTELKTERLTLRPFEENDASAVLGYATDPEWARYISQAVAADDFGFEEARAFVQRCIATAGRPITDFAIEADGSVIGSIHLVMLESDRGMAELACLIGRPHWATGYAAEAARGVLAYAFDELQLARIFARADARNRRSVRAMEKLGLQQEALLRSHRVDRTGSRCDEVVFGMLRKAWERRRSGAV